MPARAHVFVSGKVQGVGFRASTRRKARELGVTGWVKNLRDGRVEAVFEGSEEKVKKIVEWTKSGPRTARVDGIEVDYEKFRGEYDKFEVRF